MPEILNITVNRSEIRTKQDIVLKAIDIKNEWLSAERNGRNPAIALTYELELQRVGKEMWNRYGDLIGHYYRPVQGISGVLRYEERK